MSINAQDPCSKQFILAFSKESSSTSVNYALIFPQKMFSISGLCQCYSKTFVFPLRLSWVLDEAFDELEIIQLI